MGTWSPDYKKNRFYVVNHMKIKDYQNYDSLREYYGVLNGQNPNTGISPRAPTFSGLGNPTKILDNIKTSRASSAVSTPVAAPAMKQSEMRFFAQNFTRAFASSYTIPAGK